MKVISFEFSVGVTTNRAFIEVRENGDFHNVKFLRPLKELAGVDFLELSEKVNNAVDTARGELLAAEETLLTSVHAETLPAPAPDFIPETSASFKGNGFVSRLHSAVVDGLKELDKRGELTESDKKLTGNALKMFYELIGVAKKPK